MADTTTSIPAADQPQNIVNDMVHAVKDAVKDTLTANDSNHDKHDIKVSILGTNYTVSFRTLSEDPLLEDADGYCDWTIHTIVVRREIEGSLAAMDEYVKKVTRHEIVHAFLMESGLQECSGSTDAWASNETMVDWIARQGPKLYKAWRRAQAV